MSENAILKSSACYDPTKSRRSWAFHCARSTDGARATRVRAGYRIGRHVRYRVDDVEQWLDARRDAH